MADTDILKVATVTWQGKDYRITRPLFETQLLYGRYLQTRAAHYASAVRDSVGPEYYEHQMRVNAQSAAAGEYDWGSRVCLASIYGSDLNFAHLMWLVLQQEHPTLTVEQVRQMLADTGGALLQAWEEIIRPNPSTPPQPEAGKSGQ